MNFNEAEVIRALSSVFATPDVRVLVGIGDDAAVVAPLGNVVVTTDMAVQDVHFRLDWSSAYDIGRKITVANLADIYAMGADPTHLILALSLTGDESMEWILELARGITHEADRVGASVVGGDLARSSNITIAMTALGSVLTPIRRSGASAFEKIYLSSLPGWSAAGLSILQRGANVSTLPPTAKIALEKFRSPLLDVERAHNFRSATSMCDISDSLMTQGEQMAHASQCAFRLDRTLFENHQDFEPLIELASEMSLDVWDWILGGGEDHVFMATGKNLEGLHVGEIEEGIGLHILGMKKAPDTWRHFT
ncbi:unannotated protein [freshwater metagenome]|uniref:Unannotated protein n=1 Tax=freshwater metagenome TaxID=449393 RepID=A0A6J7XR19_9ZZZZ|nr:thiamine-phosphate kinase [Actinomycetota bacterium]